MAGSGKSKKTSSSVEVWGKETGVENSDDDNGSESGSSGMGGRRLAGGPEGGSEGAESGYPESLPEALDIHGKKSNGVSAGESNDATM